MKTIEARDKELLFSYFTKQRMKLVNASRTYAMLRVIEQTAMRQGEARALTFDCIRKQSEQVSIITIPDVPGCKTGTREVPLVMRTKDGQLTKAGYALENWLKVRADKLNQNGRKSDVIFCTSSGAYLDGHNFSNYVARISEEVGTSCVITPHMFRHTRATELVRDNVALPKVQFYLGHKNLSTTMIYTHINLEDITDVARSHAI